MSLETLESRLVLTTSTWSGLGTDVNWMTPANWLGTVAPVAGNDLAFPVGVTGTSLTNNNNFPAGTSFGSIKIQNNGYTLNGNALALTGSIDASQTSGSSTLGLPVAFGSNTGSVSVDNAAATLNISGVITGTQGLTKTGAGVLDLTGINTYTGTTLIDNGTLHVDGTGTVGAVTALTGTTLGGTGNVASITTTAATISPGTSSPGVLTDTGSLTLDPSSSFAEAINGETAGTGYSQLKVGGPINLDNAILNLTLSPTFTPNPGDTFTIINNTGTGAITGNFAGLMEGAMLTVSGQEFTISYQGGTDHNSVVLTFQSVATATWTGDDIANSDGWMDAANWENDTPPSTGYDVIFPMNVPSNQQMSNNDFTGLSLTSILVQDANFQIGGNGVTLSGGIDASQSSGTSTVSLPATFSNAGSVTVDAKGAVLDLGGMLTASIGLVKQGAGELDLTANSGSLGVTVDGGTLLVGNSSGTGTVGGVSANSGTTLGGTGTVASITTTAATVSPGVTSTSPGTLTDTGPVVLDSHSTFVVPINGANAGTNYSQLAAGGAINLGSATLVATLASGFTPTAGEQFTIINNTGSSAITGTFAGLHEGATLTLSNTQFSISYKGGSDHNSVVLTALSSTTTTVSPVTGSPVFGQSVTLTATVAASGGGTGTPTGTVQFVDGSTDLGSPVMLNSSGVAMLTTTGLHAGSNSITAVYSGDTNFKTSTSPAVPVTVGQASTQVALSSSPNPSTTGQNVFLSATVSAVSPGSGTPTGSVTFFNGSTSLGSPTLINGVATLNTTSLPVGTDSITAVYSSSTNFKASTSPAVNQVVMSGTATIQVTASNTNPAGFQPVTLYATVHASGGSGTPTGTVTFFDSQGTDLGSGTLTGGVTSISVPFTNFAIGPESITAVYSGDSSFTGVTSSPLAMVVGSPSELYVNQIYQTIMGTMAGYGADYWIAQLNGGYSPKRVATSILRTPEARIGSINGAYQFLLGRPATSAEVKRALDSGIAYSLKLYAQILGSKDYYQTNGGGTTDGFLTALANAWFGTPFNSKLQARLARKLHQGASRYQVAWGVITSRPGLRAALNSFFYEPIFQRTATPKEQARYSPLVKDQGNVLYATLFASPEFKAKYVSI